MSEVNLDSARLITPLSLVTVLAGADSAAIDNFAASVLAGVLGVAGSRNRGLTKRSLVSLIAAAVGLLILVHTLSMETGVVAARLSV